TRRRGSPYLRADGIAPRAGLAAAAARRAARARRAFMKAAGARLGVHVCVPSRKPKIATVSSLKRDRRAPRGGGAASPATAPARTTASERDPRTRHPATHAGGTGGHAASTRNRRRALR